MRLGPGLPDLTYCTNIHPAEGWAAVFESLRQHAPALRARLAPDAPFGIGLRLSAEEAHELSTGSRLREFGAWLQRECLYVALLNGYPYGSFHGPSVKHNVFAPDWRDQRRLHYSLRLAEILAELLPEGGEGGISTIPLSAKCWISAGDATALNSIAGNLVRFAQAMDRMYSRTSRLIHLDIEPEPGGLIENTAETVSFFRKNLLRCAAEHFRGGANPEEIIRRHIRICYDACHFAVEYESPRESMEALEAAGIAIGRVQVSSALSVELPASVAGRGDVVAKLRPLAASPYLHQVIERSHTGELRFYPDLGDALDRIQQPDAAEWRIHFHVPVFTERLGPFGTTREDLRQTVALAVDARRTAHLEIETYTWQLLPEGHRLDLIDSIEREFQWTRLTVCERQSSSISLG